MRIIFENFECHTDSSFTIPDTGLVLLNGNSGKGKTSVLRGIVYALFGVGKDVCTWGKTKTKVILEYKDLKIIRTSGPKSLKVSRNEEKYEGDEAQSVICSYFQRNGTSMTKEEFMASSFVLQAEPNSLLALTPAKQLEFIKALAFDTNESKKLYEKIKLYTNRVKEEKCTLLGKLETTQKLYEESLKKFKKLPKSKICKIDIEKEEKIVESKHKEIETLTKQLKVATTTNKSFLSLTERKTTLLDSLVQKEQLLENLRKHPVKKPISPTKTKKQIEEVKTDLQLLKLSETKVSLVEKINKEKALLDELKNKLQDIHLEPIDTKERDCLLDQKSQQEEIDKKYKALTQKNKEYSKYIATHAKSVTLLFNPKVKGRVTFSTLKTQILQDLPKIKEMIISAKGLKCPSCETTLDLVEGILIKSKEPIAPIEELKEKLAVMETIVEYINESEKNKLWIKNNYNSKKLDDIIKSLKAIDEKIDLYDKSKEQSISLNEQIKVSLQSIQDLEAQLQEINLSNYQHNDAYTQEFYESLLSKLGKLESVNKEFEKYILSIKSTEKDIDSLKDKLETIEKELTNLKQIDTDKLSESIEKLTLEIKSISKEISDAKAFLVYQESKESVDTLKKSVDEIKEKLNETTKLLEGFYGLAESEKEAELFAVSEYVESINNAAAFYLDQFIVEGKVSISLSADPAEKKMRTNVTFNGKSVSFNKLSVGQKQRAELCFCLGLSDMFATKILLLDECVNNIQANLNAEIMKYLKELAKNRLIIVSSHVAVRGHFDLIIDV